ncbi:MAG: methyltransferase domain-containing protein [Fidelibacterota bacterium]
MTVMPSELTRQIQFLNEEYPDIPSRALRAFLEQHWFAETIIQPLFNILSHDRFILLEIGPAEGGLLKYFSEQGGTCYGLELSEARYTHSLTLNPDTTITFLKGDITDLKSYSRYQLPSMDYIVLRDVIEHIPDKWTTLRNIFTMLKPGGKVYVSFPPKWAPYAGHQQTAENRLVKIPYLYLLPNFIYDKLLHGLKLPGGRIQYLLNTKKNRISDREFLQIAVDVGFVIQQSTPFFIRPEYKFRFGLSPGKNRAYPIPLLKHLFTNGIIFILEKPNEGSEIGNSV